MASKRVSESKVVVSPGAAQTSSVRKPAAKRTTRTAKPVETPSVSIAEPETVASPAGVTAGEKPSQESIAALAYSYWVARGCEGGSPEEDWLRAEQELRAASAAAATA